MRGEKQFLLDEVVEHLEKDPSFLVMKYTGLTANGSCDFRNQIAKLGGHVKIVKKRLLAKAAQDKGVELQAEQLEGHVGLVFGGEDFLETTKAVFTYGKETKGHVEVLAGHFEGVLHDAKAMQMLSELPGKDEMRAQLLSVFEAPMRETVSTMDALLCSVLHCIQNKVEQVS